MASTTEYTYVGNKRPEDFAIDRIRISETEYLNLGESAPLTNSQYKYLSQRWILAAGTNQPVQPNVNPTDSTGFKSRIGEILRAVQTADFSTGRAWTNAGGDIVPGLYLTYYSDGATPIRIRGKGCQMYHTQANKGILMGLYEGTTELDRASAYAPVANSGGAWTIESQPFVPTAGWHTYHCKIAVVGAVAANNSVAQCDEKYPSSLWVEELGPTSSAPMVSERGQDRIVAGETHVLIKRQDYIAGSKEGVIVGHGRGGSSLTHLDGNAGYLAWSLAREGYPTLCPDLGGIVAGQTAWGNDAAIARCTDAMNYVRGARAGGKAGPVILYGGSMGGLTLMNWARQNKAQVRALILVTPVVNLDYVHDNNVGGFAAEIETAYGGAAPYEAALATHSPSLYAADLAGIPTMIYHSTDDPYYTTAHINALKAAIGAKCIVRSLGAVGHTSTGLSAIQFAADVKQVLAL